MRGEFSLSASLVFIRFSTHAGEPGPSVLARLTFSTCLAVFVFVVMAGLVFVMFSPEHDIIAADAGPAVNGAGLLQQTELSVFWVRGRFSASHVVTVLRRHLRNLETARSVHPSTTDIATLLRHVRWCQGTKPLAR
jgi:hypothetical protein